MIKLQDKSYYAGLLDGEGSISISNSCVKKSKKYLRLSVRICMIDLNGVLQKGQSIWGGRVVSRKPRNERCRATIEWQIQDKVGGQFLKDVLPFLMVKKQEAELGIEFRKFVSINNMVGDNIQNYRFHLMEGIKGLHHSIPFQINQKLRDLAIKERRYGKREISEETRRRLSQSHKGLWTRGMFAKGHVPWTKGRKFSEEHKRKIGLANKVALRKYYAKIKICSVGIVSIIAI